MYSYIEGIVAEIGTDTIVLDNNGIGYEIQIPIRDLTGLPHTGSTLKLHTYYQVSENAVALYGFIKKEEKELFLKLITVSGIGPKGALSLLSTLSVEDIQMAILSDDEKAIARAPGIGAKTAKRLILELKDKVSLSIENAYSSESLVESETGVRQDAVMALTTLGYSYSQAATAVRKVSGDLGVEEILKEALKHII